MPCPMRIILHTDPEALKVRLLHTRLHVCLNPLQTPCLINLPRNTMVCNQILGAQSVRIVLERPILDATRARCAIPAKAVDGIEDRGVPEVACIARFVPPGLPAGVATLVPKGLFVNPDVEAVVGEKGTLYEEASVVV